MLVNGLNGHDKLQIIAKKLNILNIFFERNAKLLFIRLKNIKRKKISYWCYGKIFAKRRAVSFVKNDWKNISVYRIVEKWFYDPSLT